MGKTQSGYMMLVVAVFLVVIAGLATAFVAMMVSGSNSSIAALSANSAYDLAVTGLEHGGYQLSLGTCNSAWSSTVSVSGQGEYQYNCTSYSVSSTLSGPINGTVTSIPLSSTANLATFGAVTIDSEVIYYNGISGNFLINARRGQGGSVASHLSGAAVNQQQYVITSQAGVPTLSVPNGKVTLGQATLVSNPNYYAVGTTNGQNALIMNYNGSSWSITTNGVSGVSLYYIDINSTYGMAVGYNNGNQSSVYTFSGGAWSLAASGITSTRYSSASCNKPLAPSDCWIGGQTTLTNKPILRHGTITYTASASTSNFAINGLSCISGTCVAVGSSSIYRFSVNSLSPFVETTPPQGIQATLTDVECVSPTRCVAINDSGRVYYYNGSNWNTWFNIPGATSFNGLSCPTTSNCFLAGNGGKIFNCVLPITAASSCVQQTLSSGSPNLIDVACNANDDCLALVSGKQNYAYRYTGGSTWLRISLPAKYTLYSIEGTAGITTAGQVTPVVTLSQ
jgi:hypothetical protein